MPESKHTGAGLSGVKPRYAGAFVAAAEFSPLPFLLCDTRARVLGATCGAHHLIQANQLVEAGASRLQLPTRGQQQQMLDTLQRAMADDAPDPRSAALILKLERSKQPPLSLMVCAPPGHSAPPLAVYLHDPGYTPRISEHTLCELYGLTPAEARVARIMVNGCSTREVAQHNGTSVHTVRNQIKSVFAKTGASRQAELAILLLGGPAHTR